MYLKEKQVGRLETEVISVELKVYLTRLLRDKVSFNSDGERIQGGLGIIGRQNYLINKARNLQGMPLYHLETDDEYYHHVEYIWHEGEFELMVRRLSTPHFIEFSADLIKEEYLSLDEMNRLLEKDIVSFRFERKKNTLAVKVLSLQSIEEAIKELNKDDSTKTHQNIRLLFSRAEGALGKKDHSSLIHTCANIFETLAKDIVGIPSIANQTLGGFFARYRNDSGLPEPVLDYILNTYNLRSTTPLAGHGSTEPPPSLNDKQAIVLLEMTRAFVTTEYRLITLRETQQQERA